jgi:hypothetical protein
LYRICTDRASNPLMGGGCIVALKRKFYFTDNASIVLCWWQMWVHRTLDPGSSTPDCWGVSGGFSVVWHTASSPHSSPRYWPTWAGTSSARHVQLYQSSAFFFSPNMECALSFPAPIEASYTPFATGPDSYIENGNDVDVGNPARCRAEPPRSHRPLPAIPRWRRSPWALDALHSKGPYGAAQPRTSKSQPSSSEAMWSA